MPIEYLKGQKQDLEEIVDFANYVFSHSGDVEDFPTLLPKLYGSEADTAACHHLVKENGRIRAMVGLFPSKLSILGEELTVYGIGTVCVHPYRRGSGYMKELMARAREEMENHQADLAVLGGQRQRYQYFGFEACGQSLIFTVTKASARHCLTGLGKGFALLPLEGELIGKAFDLHNGQEPRILREPRLFADTLRSWKATPYAIIKDGVFAGYLSVLAEKQKIIELALCDSRTLRDVLAAYFETFAPKEIKIALPPYRDELVRTLSAICSSMEIVSDANFLVLNYEKILRTAMKLKKRYSPLPQGSAVVEINGKGRFAVQVSGENCDVTRTEAEPDVSLSELEAMAAFFSPVSLLNKDSRLPDFLNLLLPLPLYIDSCDKV